MRRLQPHILYTHPKCLVAVCHAALRQTGCLRVLLALHGLSGWLSSCRRWRRRASHALNHGWQHSRQNACSLPAPPTQQPVRAFAAVQLPTPAAAVDWGRLFVRLPRPDLCSFCLCAECCVGWNKAARASSAAKDGLMLIILQACCSVHLRPQTCLYFHIKSHATLARRALSGGSGQRLALTASIYGAAWKTSPKACHDMLYRATIVGRDVKRRIAARNVLVTFRHIAIR